MGTGGYCNRLVALLWELAEDRPKVRLAGRLRAGLDACYERDTLVKH